MPKRPQPVIGTLDPARLQASDFYDFSGYSSVDVYPRTHAYGDTKGKPHRVWFRQTGSGKFQHKEHFPSDSHGFLYYHATDVVAPSDTPPSASAYQKSDSSRKIRPPVGEIRLRITDDRDPASFSSGRDLLLPSGIPWHIMSQLYGGSTLRRLLVQDGFISDDHDTANTHHRRCCTYIMTRLEEPFPMDMAAVRPGLYFKSLTDGTLHFWRWRNPLKAAHRKLDAYYKGRPYILIIHLSSISYLN